MCRTMTDDNFFSPGSVERSAACTEISALIHRYGALAKEQADWDGMASSSHPDGVMHLPNGNTISPAHFSPIVKGGSAEHV